VQSILEQERTKILTQYKSETARLMTLMKKAAMDRDEALNMLQMQYQQRVAQVHEHQNKEIMVVKANAEVAARGAAPPSNPPPLQPAPQGNNPTAGIKWHHSAQSFQGARPPTTAPSLMQGITSVSAPAVPSLPGLTPASVPAATQPLAAQPPVLQATMYSQMQVAQQVAHSALIAAMGQATQPTVSKLLPSTAAHTACEAPATIPVPADIPALISIATAPASAGDAGKATPDLKAGNGLLPPSVPAAGNGVLPASAPAATPAATVVQVSTQSTAEISKGSGPLVGAKTAQLPAVNSTVKSAPLLPRPTTSSKSEARTAPPDSVLPSKEKSTGTALPSKQATVADHRSNGTAGAAPPKAMPKSAAPIVIDLHDSDDDSGKDKKREIRDAAGTVVLTGTENKVSLEVQSLVCDFLSGRMRTKSREIKEVLLHREIRLGADRKTVENTELVFEMNPATGKWRKIRRTLDGPPEGGLNL